MTQTRTEAEVIGLPRVELFEPMDDGHVPADIVAHVRIMGRVLPLMFQPDEDGNVWVATEDEGYEGTPAAWSWGMLWDEFGDDMATLDTTAARAAAQGAYDAALAEQQARGG